MAFSPRRPLVVRRSFALAASTPLFAEDKGDQKAAAKGAKEKLFNTGAVFGTGAQRTVQLAAVAGPKGAVSRAVPLKGGRGRKKPKVEKKHLLLAARKKQLRKLWGKHTGTPFFCVSFPSDSGNWAVPERSVVSVHRPGRTPGPRLHNLYDLCRKLPNDGLGLRVFRSHFARYPEPSHWTVVKVSPAAVRNTHCLFFLSVSLCP